LRPPHKRYGRQLNRHWAITNVLGVNNKHNEQQATTNKLHMTVELE
jgi:hypothetical protein